MVLKELAIFLSGLFLGKATFFVATKIYRRLTAVKKFYFLRSNTACQICFNEETPNLCKLEQCSYQLLMDIVKLIQKAEKTIEVACPLLELKEIANALVEASLERGLFVRIVVDGLTNPGEPTRNCIAAGIRVKPLATETLMMHNKFMIIDEKILIRSSLNWTKACLQDNYENLQVFKEPGSRTKWYLDYFNLMWNENSNIHASEETVNHLKSSNHNW